MIIVIIIKKLKINKYFYFLTLKNLIFKIQKSNLQRLKLLTLRPYLINNFIIFIINFFIQLSNKQKKT